MSRGLVAHGKVFEGSEKVASPGRVRAEARVPLRTPWGIAPHPMENSLQGAGMEPGRPPGGRRSRPRARKRWLAFGGATVKVGRSG